jgi:hypothetical protein
MTTIQDTKSLLVVRTDFSNQPVWERIREILGAPLSNFPANVQFVDDEEYKGATKGLLLELLLESYNHSFMVIVDEMAIFNSDHPLIVVELRSGLGREIRAIPSAIQQIEANLSMTHMSFENLASSVDGSGVYRGYHQCGL